MFWFRFSLGAQLKVSKKAEFVCPLTSSLGLIFRRLKVSSMFASVKGLYLLSGLELRRTLDPSMLAALISRPLRIPLTFFTKFASIF